MSTKICYDLYLAVFDFNWLLYLYYIIYCTYIYYTHIMMQILLKVTLFSETKYFIHSWSSARFRSYMTPPCNSFAYYRLITTCERPICVWWHRGATVRTGHRLITNILTLMDQRRLLSLTAVSDVAFGAKRAVNGPMFAYRWHCGSFTATYFATPRSSANTVARHTLPSVTLVCRKSPPKTPRKR